MHLIGDDVGPTFGLWYDLRQRLPLGDHASFYPGCLEEIEEGERFGFAGAWLSEHRFVEDGYLPSPLAAARTPTGPCRGAPYDHYCFRARLPGVTHEQAQENMRLFAVEVTPRVRAATETKPT